MTSMMMSAVVMMMLVMMLLMVMWTMVMMMLMMMLMVMMNMATRTICIVTSGWPRTRYFFSIFTFMFPTADGQNKKFFRYQGYTGWLRIVANTLG